MMSTMTIADVEKALVHFKLISNEMKIEIGIPESYDVRKRWFATDETAYIPHADENGVYLYTNLDGQVLYIGMGDQKSGGGIGNRACSHLGKAYNQVGNMFPSHQWINADSVGELMSQIKCGEFLVWTIPVIPGFGASLAEVYLQTYSVAHFAQLPALNSKIG